MKPLVASGNVDDPRPEGTPHPNFGEAFRFWLKLGFNSFGGPTGQIAIMHAELGEKKKWISEAASCMRSIIACFSPDLKLNNWSIYVGWFLHKTSGGIVPGAPGETLNPLRGCNPNPTQYSITPSLHVAGFEDEDENEARGERMALTLKTRNLFQNIYLERFFQ